MKPLLFLALLWPLSVVAADLDPKLAPLAATQLKQTADIQAGADAVIAKGAAVYAGQLKDLGEKALKSRDLVALKAIQEEQKQLEKGAILPVANADLPKLVQAHRKALIKVQEDAEANVAKQRKDLDMKYLAALAKLDPKDGSSPELSSQIEEEQKRVLSGVYGPITNLQTQLAGTRWQNINKADDIAEWGADGSYRYWKYTTPDRETLVVHWNPNSTATWKLAKDGKTLQGDPVFRLIPGKK